MDYVVVEQEAPPIKNPRGCLLWIFFWRLVDVVLFHVPFSVSPAHHLVYKYVVRHFSTGTIIRESPNPTQVLVSSLFFCWKGKKSIHVLPPPLGVMKV
jgi:hypothetical protein